MPRRCQARLGSFNWSGSQSSSGAWVVPAFQLHTARLDAVDPRPPVALAAIRQPRMLASPAAAGPTSGAAAGSAAAPAGLQRAEHAAGEAAEASGGGSCPGGHGCTAPAEALAQQLQQKAVLASSAPPLGPLPRFTHLILDCDGVMVDSERASCEALRQSILQARPPVKCVMRRWPSL
jgi:hypothetical protein